MVHGQQLHDDLKPQPPSFYFVDVSSVPQSAEMVKDLLVQGCCTEAGMFALRERRVHVTQEDFELAVAKVMKKDSDKNMSIRKLWK